MSTKRSTVVEASAEELAMRRKIISDPALFIAAYSPLTLEDFHIAFIRGLYENTRVVALMPATHGKTTILSWYLIWRIAANPNIRIILIAKNDEEANLYSRLIRTEFTSNIPLIRDWGPFKPNGKEVLWSNDSFSVCKRQHNDLRPTFSCFGSKSADKALGKRCEELYCDDIVTPDTTNTPEARDKQASIFDMGAETGPAPMWNKTPEGTLLVPDGIYWPTNGNYYGVKLIGTVFHPDDLFHRKAGRIDKLEPFKVHTSRVDPSYKVLYFDCWRDKEMTKPLWPGQRDAAYLARQEKTLGTINFNKRFRNIAIDEGSLVFRKIWIYGGEKGGIEYPGCLDYDRSFGEFEAEKPYKVLGFDPSTGRKGRDTTFSSFVVIGVDQQEEPMRRYLIDMRRGQMGFDDILSHLLFGDKDRSIEGLYDKHHYDEGRIEANAAQRWLLDNKRVDNAKLQGVRLTPHETQGNKHDPVMGVSSMQEMVKNGWFRIPYREPADRELAEEFIEQLLLFPEGVHDYAMAMWFADLAFRDLGSKYKAWTANKRTDSRSKVARLSNPYFARR